MANNFESATQEQPALLQCVECGHWMSPRANACPKCKYGRVLCYICSMPVKVSDRIEVHTREFRYFHRACLSTVFQVSERIQCPDCHRELSSILDLERLIEGLKSCPFCGAPSPLGQARSCFYCSLPIYSFQPALLIWKDGRETEQVVHRLCRPDQEDRNFSEQDRAKKIKMTKNMGLLIIMLRSWAGAAYWFPY
jgi:ribosomal protein L40E